MSKTDRHSAPPGRIEVITGGMFSGKSEELVRRLKRALIARQRVQVFQPADDTRGSERLIVTRDQRQLEAISVSSSEELHRNLSVGVEVVGVDEAQFFDRGLVQLAMDMADLGVRMIIAGLDQDFSRQPFGPMPELLAVAEYVDKMHAVCVRCGSPAHYSQRTAGGSEQRQVGDVESYEARCRQCFEAFVPASDQSRRGFLGAEPVGPLRVPDDAESSDEPSHPVAIRRSEG